MTELCGVEIGTLQLSSIRFFFSFPSTLIVLEFSSTSASEYLGVSGNLFFQFPFNVPDFAVKQFHWKIPFISDRPQTPRIGQSVDTGHLLFNRQIPPRLRYHGTPANLWHEPGRLVGGCARGASGAYFLGFERWNALGTEFSPIWYHYGGYSVKSTLSSRKSGQFRSSWKWWTSKYVKNEIFSCSNFRGYPQKLYCYKFDIYICSVP